MNLSFLLTQAPIQERICRHLEFEEAIALHKVIFPVPLTSSFLAVLSNGLMTSFVLPGVNETTICVYELLKKSNIGTAINSALRVNRKLVVQLLIEISSKYYTQYFSQMVEIEAYLNAAHFGNCEILQFFLDRGIPINEGYSGQTALLTALSAGQMQAAEFLLVRGADVNFIPPHHSPMLVAIACNHSKFRINAINFLVTHGVNLERDLDSAFCMAAKYFCVANLKRLYEISQERGIPVSKDVALVNWSARFPNNSRKISEVVQFLIENGANINTVDHSGNSVLNLAVDAGFSGLVEYLLEKGAMIFPNNYNVTALHHCARQNNNSMIKSLLDHLIRQGNIDLVNLVNNQGQKAIDCTTDPEIKRLLINKY